SSEVRVGIEELLNVTVTVENRGENSYNSRVILTYPAGLSYRKFTIQQGRIECNSLDSEDGLSQGMTDCTIDKPIFKSKTGASFIVSYGIETNSQLERKIFVTANATSGNQEHAPTSELYKKKSIDVKYSIFMTFESSLSYNNFTFGKNDLKKPVQKSVKVKYNFYLSVKIGLQSAKFLLTSTASLDYDKTQYIYFSTGSDNSPPVRRIEAEVEVYPEPDFTKEIVGGCLGGLAFLALLTAGLYKAGFFKSKYKQMINENAADGPSPGTDAGATLPE
ncbi:integrin alpha-M-like, partial [Pundamilia nyererei]|uniref:Integrin alpha-M-like n=1 Tax=Pundamilia nyererei TaxID=303518 RepID=A0A9Y3W0D3_9CICH